MEIPGFELSLHDFCAFCPDFSPELEKMECSSLDGSVSCKTSIHCKNRSHCESIAINIRNQVKVDGKKE